MCITKHMPRLCCAAILHPALVLEIAVAQASRQTCRQKKTCFWGQHVPTRVALSDLPLSVFRGVAGVIVGLQTKTP